MGTLKANWPTIISAFVATGLGLAVKLGAITPEVASLLGGLVVPFTAFVHRLSPPGAK